MRYRVLYQTPCTNFGLDLPEGAITATELVGRFETDDDQPAGDPDEDDDSLSHSEIWEYDVAPAHDQQFRDAVAHRALALEIEGFEADEP